MKRTIRFLTALLVLLTTGSNVMWAESITYLWYNTAWNYFQEMKDPATKITSSSNNLSGYCYVEGNVTISSTVKLNGDTEIILCDDSELKINVSGEEKGINLNGRSLTIYAQSSGSHAGKLTINSSNYGIYGTGDVIINGGIINITSTSADGIDCTNFTVNGGNVTAVASTADMEAVYTSEAVTINGGTVSVTGGKYGIYPYYGHDVTINGGIFTATGGTAGIASVGAIKLGWTNAEDYIECSSYNTLGTINTLKDFYIDGSTSFAAANNISAGSINGKTLTPNSGDPIYDITLGTGLSSDNVEFDRAKAFEGERVAVTVTPPTGKILASITYNDGTNDYALTQEANDYVITMPAAYVTVNATFVTPVAQIGDTKYATLAAALADVSDSDTEITMLANSTETGLTGIVPGSHSVIINLNGKTVSIDKIDVPSALTIKNGTLECKTLYTASVGFETELTFDNATVTITDELQWPSNNIILQDGANVTLHEVMWFAGGADNGDDGADFTIADNASKFTLVNCTVSGYNNDRVRTTMSQWVQPGKTLVVDGTTVNNLTLRASWGIQLTYNLGKTEYGVDRVTMKFFDGGTGTDAPTAETFNPTAYPDANAIEEIDNSDGQNRYIIVHLEPAWSLYYDDAYWTDTQLLYAIEYGATLSRTRGIDFDLVQKLTLLKRDTYDDNGTERTAYNGAGWYYYTLPKEHSVANGYFASAIDGFAPRCFDLDLGDVSQSSDLLTVTVNTNGWSADLEFDPEMLTYTFDGNDKTPKIKTITVKKGTETMMTLNADDIGFNNLITVGSEHRIGNVPIALTSAGRSMFEYSPYYEYHFADADKAYFVIPMPLTVADETATKGTETNPWRVRTAEEMNLFAKVVNFGEYSFNGEFVRLMNDITYDATTSADFLPVGFGTGYSYGTPFQGTFFGSMPEGDNNTISNLNYKHTVSTPYEVNIGLFGNVKNGTIKDLTLSGCTFDGNEKGTNYGGALAGYICNTTISNVTTTSCEVYASKKGQPTIGGIVGHMEGGSHVTECTVTGTSKKPAKVTNKVTDPDGGFSINTGGIAGFSHESEIDHCTVENCIISSEFPNSYDDESNLINEGNIISGILGGSYSPILHDNMVKGSTSITDILYCDATSAVGAIYGDCGGDEGSIPVLYNNYYEKSVNVSYTTSEGRTTLSGYTPRGRRQFVYDDEYNVIGVEIGDVTELVDDSDPENPVTYIDGAKMFVKPATLDLTADDGRTLTFDKTTTPDVADETHPANCYSYSGTTYYYAVGDDVTLTATYNQRINDGRTFYDEVTIGAKDGNGGDVTITPDDATLTGNTYTRTYTLTMPDDGATITAIIDESKWFTVPSNGQQWMSFYHEWEATAPANYTVSDGDGTGKTIEALTVSSVDSEQGSFTTTALKEVVGESTRYISYSAVPTLFHCESYLPALLKFEPNTTATKPDPLPTVTNFIGVSTDTDLSGENIYMINGEGDFIRAYLTETDKTLAAHRCYLDLSDNPTAHARLHNAGEANGIVSTTLDAGQYTNDKWYSIDGRKFDSVPTKKGVYIYKGKKIVVR